MPIATSDFDYIRTLVRERSAIVLDDGKEYLVESRLAPLARSQGLETIEALVAKLRRNGEAALSKQVVEAMTTNETSWFRDVHPFNALRQHVLPDLVKARSSERVLNIWSAACSTGQEPYTIALTLREHFPELAGWTVRILATDLSCEALAKAREGRYAQIEVNRGLPAQLLVKHFQREGLGWQINEDVRRMVEFRPFNLIEPWPALQRMDLVFLRNVLIYFDIATKRMIFDRVARVLRPDGYLFIGAAESMVGISDGFERLQFDKAGCYRQRR